MKVEIIGKLNMDIMAKNLIEIADNCIERVERENEEVKVNSYKVHDNKGKPEMFKWIVNKDRDETITNKKELEFKEVKSYYKDNFLTEESSVIYSDMTKIVYTTPEKFKVVRVYQHDKLIQEYKHTLLKS